MFCYKNRMDEITAYKHVNKFTRYSFTLFPPANHHSSALPVSSLISSSSYLSKRLGVSLFLHVFETWNFKGLLFVNCLMQQ